MSKEQRANSLIRAIGARQIFDSKGMPTVEVEITTGDGVFRSQCPAESSGPLEAVCLRDGDKLFGGKTVLKCIERINSELLHSLVGVSVQDQSSIDAILTEVDGTDRFQTYGANVMFPISAACCLAGAANSRCPLWKYIAKIADTRKCSIPVPLVSIFAGGPQNANQNPFMDVMIAPVGATSFFEAIKVVMELYGDINKQMAFKGCTDDGGTVTKVPKCIEDMLEAINLAIHNAGLEGKVTISIDVSAFNFVQK